MTLTCLDLCSGAGGQARGLESAGFTVVGLVEKDLDAVKTLSANRPDWNVIHDDIRNRSWRSSFRGVDLLAAGAPCSPFSDAGSRQGAGDPRDLLRDVTQAADELQPALVLIENVPALVTHRFAPHLQMVLSSLEHSGYRVTSYVVRASDFGVPQSRRRLFVLGVHARIGGAADCPQAGTTPAPTVGSALADLMAANGWSGALAWAQRADRPAPTIVGGSHLHGGPDLGPSRSRSAWAALGVDGRAIADAPPPASAPPDHVPRLTLRMVARLQGFPDDWQFAGSKTSIYRQIGNALPSSVAAAAGRSLAVAHQAHGVRHPLTA